MRIGMEAGNEHRLPTSSGARFATASARKPIRGGKRSLFVVNGMTSTRQALSQRSHTPRITWVRFGRSSPRLVDDTFARVEFAAISIGFRSPWKPFRHTNPCTHIWGRDKRERPEFGMRRAQQIECPDSSSRGYIWDS